MPPDIASIMAVALLAAFVQSVSGFGSAMIMMPLASWIVGIQTAAPLVALATGSLEFSLLLYYRHSFELRAVSRITASAVVGIPVGILALRVVPESVILALLGVLLAGFALYALVVPRLPMIRRRGWVYLFGFVAGCLGGAYNTAGPPIILYGNLRRWPRDRFKSNLQGFFVLVNVFIITAHAIGGNLTAPVWLRYAWSLPAIAVGLLVGVSTDRWLKPERFRMVVLVLVLLLGVSLLL